MLNLPVDRPRATLAAALLLVLLCALGLPRLSINSDTRVFFSDGNVNRTQLDAFDARYNSGVNLFLALHAQEGTVLTRERLDVFAALTEAAWALPYATRVEGITNAVHVTSDAESIVIGDMYEPGSDEPVAAAAERITADSLLAGRLIATDRRTAAINITFDYPLASSAVTDEILSATKAMVEASGARAAGLEAWYAGRVASSNAFAVAGRRDLTTLLPVSFVAILGLLIVLIRSARAATALFLTAALAAASALGIAGWAGLQLNAATAHTATVIIALGVASLSHLVLLTRRILRRGARLESAIIEALRSDVRPIALTLGTTCIGFLSLNSADAPPFREMGTFVAIGALFCLALGVTALPALLYLWRVPAGSSSPFIAETIARSTGWILAHRSALLIGTPLAVAVAALGMTQITINDTFPDYFDESFDFRTHTDRIEDHLTGLEVVEFDIGNGRSDGIFEKTYIDRLERFEGWLTRQDKVVHVASILETFRRINQHMTDGRPQSRVVPRDRATLAQYMLLYEISLPPGLDLTNAVTVDKARSRMTVIMHRATTRDVRELRERAEAWWNDPPRDGIQAAGTGLAVMFAYLSSLNVNSMIGGTALALILISGILLGAFRSVRYGLISLVPNLLPGVIAFGLWGYVVGEVGVAVSVVGAMALGIIVDDTIHLIWRYRQARKEGATPEEAVAAMFAIVGEPMLMSSVVLVVGFAMLAVSGFHITSSTGILTAAMIGFALLTDWFMLPPLLIAVDRALAAFEKQAMPEARPDLALEAGAAQPLLFRQAALGAKDDADALERLVQMGGAIVPLLIEALDHPGIDTRLTAARALARIGDRRAIDPLIRNLVADRAGGRALSEAERAALRQSLFSFDDPRVRDLLPPDERGVPAPIPQLDRDRPATDHA